MAEESLTLVGQGLPNSRNVQSTGITFNQVHLLLVRRGLDSWWAMLSEVNDVKVTRILWSPAKVSIHARGPHISLTSVCRLYISPGFPSTWQTSQREEGAVGSHPHPPHLPSHFGISHHAFQVTPSRQPHWFPPWTRASWARGPSPLEQLQLAQEPESASWLTPCFCLRWVYFFSTYTQREPFHFLSKSPPFASWQDVDGDSVVGSDSRGR